MIIWKLDHESGVWLDHVSNLNLFHLNHFASVDVYTRKTFPNCKTDDVYARFPALFSKFVLFGRHAIFLESSGSRLGDPGQKALQTTIEHTLFVDFCLIPLSNTCFFVRPARNVLDNRPLRISDGPDFITKDRHCSKCSYEKMLFFRCPCIVSLT